MKYKDTWDLERIFSGGTHSEALQTQLKTVEKDLSAYEHVLNAWDAEHDQSADTFIQLLQKQETFGKKLGQASTFVKMWHDAYMNDEHASVVMGQVKDIRSDVQKQSNTFMKKLVTLSDTDWERLLENSTLKEMSFALNEIRDEGKRLLSEAEETLIAELNKDGLAGWSELYDTVVATMTIPFTDEAGTTTELSVGQAMNRMTADPDPKVRKQIFGNWEAAFTKYALFLRIHSII